jgi:hypothetical protein
MQKPFSLSQPLELDSFEVQTFDESGDEEAATTYVTAAPGITCYFGDTQCGLQRCNPWTEVCF